MNLDETNIHAGREVIYSVLARMFIEIPTAKLCDELQGLMPMIMDVKDSGSKDSAVNIGIDGLEMFFGVRGSKSGHELAEFDLNTLRAYTRLFCLTDSVPVSESVYLSKEKISMQAQRDDALRFYKMCDFSLDTGSNEPEDHISYELMFMSYMAKVTRNAISSENFDKASNALSIQREFLNSHLLKWGTLFAERIQEYHSGVHTSLYLSAAVFMAGFIGMDSKFLSE